MYKQQPLTIDEHSYFLGLLRSARYKVLEDAEDFKTVCFALEELGSRLAGKRLKGLLEYKEHLSSFVEERNQADFSIHLGLLAIARNDAAHRGVFARNLSSKALSICILLESYLVENCTLVKHVMSTPVAFAQGLHTISKLRELMLENSFSYLPYTLEDKHYLISDALIARISRYLDNREKQATPIREILVKEDLIEADLISEETLLTEAYRRVKLIPLLVVDGRSQIVGVMAPFDLL